MKTALALVSSVLLAACGGPVELRDDAGERLVAAAEEIQRLLVAGDFAAVVDQIPDDLLVGGPGAKRAAVAAAEATRDIAVEIAKNMKWDPPGTIRRVGERHVCVVTYTSSVNGRPMKACQIAVSRDGGGTWGFISGSTAGVAGLRMTAPELINAIEDEIQPVEVGTRLTARSAQKGVTSADWDRLFGAPDLPAGEGAETLDFDWPDGTRLHVTRTATRVVDGPGETRRYRSVLEYDVIGEQTEDGYHVRFENVAETDPGEPATGEPVVQLDHLSQMLGDWPVDFVVKDAAAPPRPTNLDEVHAVLRKRFLEIPGVTSDPDANRMMTMMLSDSALATRSLEGWNKMVQVWHGNTIELNDPLVFDFTTGTGGVTVENVMTYSAHPSPLRTEEPARAKLLRLHTRQIPKGGVSGLQGSGLGSFVPAGKPQMEIRTWVDTSPELIPERFVKVHTLTLPVPGQGAGRATVGTRWEYVFRRDQK